ncbi:hypothetical protein NECAME_12213 [Necator americanus]|uniref:Kinesin motor domain-containing protein n=1 Tax=Necator americanus TaxID=51031 RepID=W2T0Y5_NECAM|nr:hypothetical protein NECAME_12213 [Necator americanus]ETN75665.1 hypothetical protein NECAME_12213 [Necator americanus]
MTLAAIQRRRRWQPVRAAERLATVARFSRRDLRVASGHFRILVRPSDPCENAEFAGRRGGSKGFRQRVENVWEICAFLTLTMPVANQVHIAGAAKSHSKNAFENVFGPDAAQDRICSSVLPELVQGVFNGQDCAFVAMGGKSRDHFSLPAEECQR